MVVGGFDPSTGFGISIHRSDSDDPPQVVIVGSSFPLGAMPPMTEQAQKDMEASAQQDLGTSYHVAYAMSEKTI